MAKSKSGGLLSKGNLVKVAFAGAVILWALGKINEAQRGGKTDSIAYKAGTTLGVIPKA